MNLHEAAATLSSQRDWLHSRGVRFEPGAEPYAYVSDDPARGAPYSVAMDALPTLFTEPNSGIPLMYTSFIDPQVYNILFAPLKIAEALGGEVQKGTWTDVVAMFPVAEATGEVSSYDDYSNAGVSGANLGWPQREAYLFQTIIQYGELEVARAAAARVNIVSMKEKSAATNLARFLNYSYAFGVSGLQSYGSLNDPNLSASLTPAVKAYGGTAWISGGVVRATANEIFTDIQSTIGLLITQGNGNIDTQTPMVMLISANIDNALTATNSFNVNVSKLLADNYPNLKIISGVQQYGARTATNTQGLVAGNIMQIIATEVEGQQTGFPAYNEKMRSHPIIREMSAFRQKKTAGTWGTVFRMPFAVASMVGL